jgi:hypothetical protein
MRTTWLRQPFQPQAFALTVSDGLTPADQLTGIANFWKKAVRNMALLKKR